MWPLSRAEMTPAIPRPLFFTRAGKKVSPSWGSGFEIRYGTDRKFEKRMSNQPPSKSIPKFVKVCLPRAM
jgi:hypothetical protein